MIRLDHPRDRWSDRLAWLVLILAVALVIVLLAALLAPEPGVFEGTYTPVPVVEQVP